MRTPRQVLDAFFPPIVTAGGLKLKHPFTIAHWLALEKIESPLTVAGGRSSIKLLDAVRALYVVSLPSCKVFDAVRDPDLETNAAQLAERIPLNECVPLVKAIISHINSGFGPASVDEPDDPGEGEESQTATPFRSRTTRAPVGSRRSSPRSSRKRDGRSGGR